MNSKNYHKVRGPKSTDLGGIMALLEEIQRIHGFLPEKKLRAVASRTGRSIVDIYGIATFYRSFSLKPRGKHLISVCLGTACHVRNAPVIAEEFERQLGICTGETTPDKEFTLETVNCVGACALGPIVIIDGHYFSNVGTARVKKIISKSRKGLDRIVAKTDERVFPVKVSCPMCNHSLMDHDHLIEDCPSIKMTISFGRKHGWLRLSSLYGSYVIESEYEIPVETVVNFFCPHCHAELAGASSCSTCGAPMIPMIVLGGGMVQICSRRGCKSHMLDLNGINF